MSTGFKSFRATFKRKKSSEEQEGTVGNDVI
jgi:hypothetical protein